MDCIEEMRSAYTILSGNLKLLLERKGGFEDNVNISLKEINFECVDWGNLFKIRFRRWDILYVLMNNSIS